MTYLVPGDILLKQYEGGVIIEDLPTLIMLCLLCPLLYVDLEAFLPEIYIPGGDLLYFSRPPVGPGQEPDEEMGGLVGYRGLKDLGYIFFGQVISVVCVISLYHG